MALTLGGAFAQKCIRDTLREVEIPVKSES